MTHDLPALARSRARFDASAGRRVGTFVGLTMAACLWAAGLSGGLALLFGLLPVIAGASGAGVMERCRQLSVEWETPLPLVAGGAFAGALLGFLFGAEFLALAPVAGSLPEIPAAAAGVVLTATTFLGTGVGALAAGGVAASGRGDPLVRALRAGAWSASATAVALYSGFLPWLAGWVAGGVGLLGAAEAAAIGKALSTGFLVLGPASLALLSAVAAATGTLSLGATEAWQRRIDRERHLPQNGFMQVTSMEGV